MKTKLSILATCLLIFSGCSGVVQLKRFNTPIPSSEIDLEHFLITFSDLLKKNKYEAKVIPKSERGKEGYIVRSEHGAYPTLLNAEKTSLFRIEIVRVCESDNQKIFIQFVHSTFLHINPEENFKIESANIFSLLNTNYPEMKFKIGSEF